MIEKYIYDYHEIILTYDEINRLFDFYQDYTITPAELELCIETNNNIHNIIDAVKKYLSMTNNIL